MTIQVLITGWQMISFLLCAISTHERSKSTCNVVSTNFDESRFCHAYIVRARKVIRQAVAAAWPINCRVERSFIATSLCSCLCYWCVVVWPPDVDRWLFLIASVVFPALLTLSLTRSPRPLPPCQPVIIRVFHGCCCWSAIQKPDAGFVAITCS